MDPQIFLIFLIFCNFWPEPAPPYYKSLSVINLLLVKVKRTYPGLNIRGDPIIEKSQDQDQGQGQGQDHLLPQRAALPHFLVLALTLTLVLVLRFFNYRVVPDIPSLSSSHILPLVGPGVGFIQCHSPKQATVGGRIAQKLTKPRG